MNWIRPSSPEDTLNTSFAVEDILDWFGVFTLGNEVLSASRSNSPRRPPGTRPCETGRESQVNLHRRVVSSQPIIGPDHDEVAEKTKVRLERAKLVVIAARERAVEMAQQSAARPLMMRTTVFQRRRLAQLSARKS